MCNVQISLETTSGILCAEKGKCHFLHSHFKIVSLMTRTKKESYYSELSYSFHQSQRWLDGIHGFLTCHVNIWYNSRPSVKKITERRITEFLSQVLNENIYMQNLHPYLDMHMKWIIFQKWKSHWTWFCLTASETRLLPTSLGKTFYGFIQLFTAFPESSSHQYFQITNSWSANLTPTCLKTTPFQYDSILGT